MRSDGRTQPNVATSAPGTPAILIPTNVAELTAIGPGVISAIVIRSANSWTVIHELDTTSLWISGSAA